jgi:hypothetical protein
MERIERALALFLVVTWRIARLICRGRTLADFDAPRLLEPEAWQAAYIIAKKPVAKRPRRLGEVLRPIAARLGGFLGSKGDGESSTKARWFDLQQPSALRGRVQWATTPHLKFTGKA